MKITVSPFAVFIADTVEICIAGGGGDTKPNLRSKLSTRRFHFGRWVYTILAKSEVRAVHEKLSFLEEGGGVNPPQANYAFARNLAAQDIPDPNSQKTGL